MQYHGFFKAGVSSAVLLMSLSACGPTKEQYQAQINAVEKHKRQAQQQQQTIATLQQQVEQLQTQQMETKGQLKKERARNQNIADEMEQTRQQQTALQQQLESAKKDAELSRNDYDNAKQDIQELTKTQSQMEKMLIEQQKQIRPLLVIQKTIERNEAIRKRLKKQLHKQLKNSQIQITETQHGLALRIQDQLLFDSGQVFIKASAFKILDTIGKVLKDIADKHIQVEGHTDQTKIVSQIRERYPTNWELSVTRATSVVRYLVDAVGIPPQRISAAGYGATQPITPGKTEAQRRQNRRVDIVLTTPREPVKLTKE